MPEEKIKSPFVKCEITKIPIKKCRHKVKKDKRRVVHRLYWRRFLRTADYVVGDITFKSRLICYTYEVSKYLRPYEKTITLNIEPRNTQIMRAMWFHEYKCRWEHRILSWNANDELHTVLCKAVGPYGEVIDPEGGYNDLVKFMLSREKRYFPVYVVDELHGEQ